MYNVIVLLSTYNGEKYISQQIESVLNQDNVNVELIVRDDGSTDETINILEKYNRLYSNFRYYLGENIGPAGSFIDLINNCKTDKSKEIYFAFCDQDDVWEHDKLISAIKMMTTYDDDKPLLYYSNLKIVDSDLNYLGVSTKNHYQEIKYSALIDCPATGCTEVFNYSAFDLIRNNIPKNCLMHDYWTYIVCKFFGNVVFDSTPHILYRQHENNVIGMASRNSIGERIRNKIKKAKKRTVDPRLCNAKEFYNCFEAHLDSETKKELSKFIRYKDSLPNKIILLFDNNFVSSVNNFKYKLLVLLGKL